MCMPILPKKPYNLVCGLQHPQQACKELEQVLINSPWYALVILNTKMKISCHMPSRVIMEEAVQLLQSEVRNWKKNNLNQFT